MYFPDSTYPTHLVCTCTPLQLSSATADDC